MKLIERENIDVQKWDDLVRTNNGDVFSYSWYLDALADHWCILIDDAYTKGIAIPYTKKVGVKLANIPIFSRYIEWFGSTGVSTQLNQLLYDHFMGYDLRIKQDLELDNRSELVYQGIPADQMQEVGSQATRMLKKAGKENYSVEVVDSLDTAFALIENELKGKFQGVDKYSVERLKTLCIDAQKRGGLKVFEITDHAAIICVEIGNRLLYLKGTAEEVFKKNGAMYLLMHTAIEYASEKGLNFDFGGSNVEGVKRFNHNLGGKDVQYYGFFMDRSPTWYKFIRGLKHRGNY